MDFFDLLDENFSILISITLFLSIIIRSEFDNGSALKFKFNLIKSVAYDIIFVSLSIALLTVVQSVADQLFRPKQVGVYQHVEPIEFASTLFNLSDRSSKLEWISFAGWSNQAIDFGTYLLHISIALFGKLLNFTIKHYSDLTTLLVTLFIYSMCKRNAVYLKSMNEHLQKTLPKIERDKRNEIKVSVLVAARNEEKNIRRCVQSLMNQSYSNYEVLVMNDNSTDSTEQILRELEKEHEFNEGDCGKKLFCHKNERLPANWYGKSWSVHCLAEKATGDILIITDADTMHSTDSIHFCVHSLITNDVQFLSGTPKQTLKTFGLKIIVPSMYIMSSCVIPLWLIKKTKSRFISLAIGQCMVVYKDVFDTVGGLEQVGNKICEDLQFARLLKTMGYKTSFICFEDYVSCNMYNSFKEGFFGMAKNVFSALDYNWIKYIYTTLIFGSIFRPLVVMLLLPFSELVLEQLVLNALSIFIFSLSWFRIMELHRIPRLTVLFYPLMMVTMFAVSGYSTFVTFFTRGHNWKGRRVS